jgi:two-component system sensor kinase FixL
VVDSGPGVSPDVRERLFQPFVTTKAQGMGVGLSICRTIVEAQGGRIWVDDNPQGGATFAFTLPLADHEDRHDH